MQDRVPRMQHQTVREKNLESFQILTNGCAGNSGLGPPMARRKKIDDNDASTTTTPTELWRGKAITIPLKFCGITAA